MPRKSTRENKTIYQKSRENAGFTREAAASEMSFITADRIENIETEKTSAQPEDVLEMAKAYKDPLLPNAYCSTCCPIGKKYVPQLTEKALSQITLEGDLGERDGGFCPHPGSAEDAVGSGGYAADLAGEKADGVISLTSALSCR